MFSRLGFVLLLILPAILIQFASHTSVVLNLSNFIQNYLILYLLVLLLVKLSSIVYPPLPGIAFTIASIPLVGWPLAYLIDLTGSTLGSSIAFILGKKYGQSILSRVVGQGITEKIMNTKLKQGTQVEASIVLSFASVGLSDGLAWGGSLIGFKFWPFALGRIMSHLLTTLPIFFLIAVSTSFNSWLIVAFATVLAWLMIFKFKGRYFE